MRICWSALARPQHHYAYGGSPNRRTLRAHQSVDGRRLVRQLGHRPLQITRFDGSITKLAMKERSLLAALARG